MNPAGSAGEEHQGSRGGGATTSGRHRPRLRLWLGLLVSAASLWIALARVPWPELVAALRSARVGWIALALGLQVLAVVTRAERWSALLGLRRRLGLSTWAQSIGYLVNNVLPLRIGEVARVLVMAERGRMPLAQVAASAALERVMDFAVVLLALGVILPMMDVPPQVVAAAWPLLVIAGGALAAAVWVAVSRTRADRLVNAILSRLKIRSREAILQRWGELADGLAGLADPRRAVRAIGWSLVAWGVSIGIYACVLRSIQPEANLIEATFMVVALTFSLTVPSSPGHIGVFQLVGQQALVVPFPSKYTPASALAVALLSHLVFYLVTSGMGALGLWRLGTSLARLGAEARRPAEISRAPATGEGGRA
jgi:uncharacterized protein (TIRG00374 family)